MKLEDFKGDKRTKEYKEFKAKFEAEQAKKSKGLGDDVKSVLKSKSLNKITNAIKSVIWEDGEDCGCDERAEKLNEWFPRKKTNCLTEEQYIFLKTDKEMSNSNLKREGANMMVDTYNHVFSKREKYTSCGRCLRNMRNQLYKVLEAYEG